MNTVELQAAVERAADPALQEAWDNSGWNINLHNTDIQAVMVCLDCTPAVVEEASSLGCGVVVSHHPLLFHGVKKIDSAHMPGRAAASLISHGISLYCAHTSCDSAPAGINAWLASALGLESWRPLRPAPVSFYKMAVTVPPADAGQVREAMIRAGAGSLGRYDSCTFSSAGTGTFRPLAGADPALGTPGRLLKTEEIRIEALVPETLVPAVQAAVEAVHPYEMPAVDFLDLAHVKTPAGLGAVGDLKEAVSLQDFLARVKQTLSCGTLRFSGSPDRKIRRVGICGGAGHDLAEDARKAGCDVFLTGELRHNLYLDYDMALIEAGHYDTEKCFIEIMTEALRMSEPVIQYKVAVYGFTGRERPYTDY